MPLGTADTRVVSRSMKKRLLVGVRIPLAPFLLILAANPHVPQADVCREHVQQSLLVPPPVCLIVGRLRHRHEVYSASSIRWQNLRENVPDLPAAEAIVEDGDGRARSAGQPSRKGTGIIPIGERFCRDNCQLVWRHAAGGQRLSHGSFKGGTYTQELQPFWFPFNYQKMGERCFSKDLSRPIDCAITFEHQCVVDDEEPACRTKEIRPAQVNTDGDQDDAENTATPAGPPGSAGSPPCPVSFLS
jgi:hypothetical protein